jgi:hypothetical protein
MAAGILDQAGDATIELIEPLIVITRFGGQTMRSTTMHQPVDLRFQGFAGRIAGLF